MSVAWSKIAGLREHIPLDELGPVLGRPLAALPLIGETPQSNQHFSMRRWVKIDTQQYMRCDYGLAIEFAWAASDGAFAYVLTNDPYFDDLAVSVPPVDILPDGRSFDWPAVVRLGQASGDWVFGNYQNRSLRHVSFDRFYFYYRHAIPSTGEPPVVIMVFPKLGPRIEMLSASQDVQPDVPLAGANPSKASPPIS
jgi:hypothetical protein